MVIIAALAILALIKNPPRIRTGTIERLGQERRWNSNVSTNFFYYCEICFVW